MLIGRALNSLAYRVANEERDWLTQNALLRENTFRGFGAWMLNCAEAYTKTSIEILFLCLLASINVTCWGGILDVHAACWVNCLAFVDWSGEGREYLLSLLTSLWTLQATVAALTYPIVIAFVTILVQRNASSALLKAYYIDSAAIFAGLSSLLLIFGVLLQLILIAVSPKLIANKTIASWLLIDSIWLGLNLLLTCRFLLRTFEFISPGSRKRIVTRYVTGVVWRREMLRKVRPVLYALSQKLGWLPGPSYVDEKASGPKILIDAIGADMGRAVVTIRLKGQKELSSVYFRLLGWGIRLWLRAARRDTSAEKTNSVFEKNREPLLIISVLPGRRYEGVIDLCRIEGAVEPGWLSRLLIRLSFEFAVFDETNDDGLVQEFMGDLEGEALNAIQGNLARPFEDSMNALKDLHTTLIKASEYTDDSGKPGNFSEVPENIYWNQGAHERWARVYFSLFELAVSRITENSHYFEVLSNLSGHLMGRLNKIKVLKIRETLVRLPFVLMRRLGMWWTRSIESQGVYRHEPCEPGFLKPPLFSVHDRALRVFVGAWETLKNDYFLISAKHASNTWTEISRWASCYSLHLEQTTQMLLEAIARGDQLSAEWLADVLQKWMSRLSLQKNERFYGVTRHRFVTLEMLGKPWQEVVRQLGLDESQSKKGLEEEIFYLALHNYWVDVRSVVAYILIKWGYSCECDKSLPVRIVRGLLRGQVWRDGGDARETEGILKSGPRFLQYLLRQNFADGGYRVGYRNRLDNIVEQSEGIRAPEMVSGRLYGGWGADDMASLTDGQLLLLCLASDKPWNGAREIQSEVRAWMATDDNRVRELQTYLESLTARLEEEAFRNYRAMFQCIVEKQDGGEDFHNAIESAKNGIDAAVDLIRGLRSEALRSANISQQRLVEVARAAGSKAFNKETAEFPISMFKNVTFQSQKIPERIFTIKDMHKGQYTEQEMSLRPANEDDWLAETMRNYTGAWVMFELLKRARLKSVDAVLPNTYWDSLKDSADALRKSGYSPILILDNPTRPNWVWDWQHGDIGEVAFNKRPVDLKLTRDPEEKGPRYLGHFNDIAVFDAPIEAGASYLLARELFQQVTFLTFEKNRPVKVEWHPSDVDYAKGDLLLKWGFDMALADISVTKLVYAPPEDKNQNDVGNLS